MAELEFLQQTISDRRVLGTLDAVGEFDNSSFGGQTPCDKGSQIMLPAIVSKNVRSRVDLSKNEHHPTTDLPQVHSMRSKKQAANSLAHRSMPELGHKLAKASITLAHDSEHSL